MELWICKYNQGSGIITDIILGGYQIKEILILITVNPYDRRNPKWKPFKLLWDYCKRTGYDFFVALDIIFERLDCKLVCECRNVAG